MISVSIPVDQKLIFSPLFVFHKELQINILYDGII